MPQRPSLLRPLVFSALLWLVLLLLPGPLPGQGMPTSIKLLYFPEKNFKPGDWVFYRIGSENYEGQTATDFQRVQVASEVEFRGEKCFWLETGWGQAEDRLGWTTVLVSEQIFQDSVAEARTDVHMRRMHLSNAADGTPIVSDARLANSSRPMSDLKGNLPNRTLVDRDTLVVKGRTFHCEVWEEVLESGKIQELPDSSVRYLIRTTRRRWIDPALPITALVREEERKEYFRHAWPLGKVSTDFPRQVVEYYDYDIQLIDFGSGAKPNISDRLVHVSDPTVPR